MSKIIRCMFLAVLLVAGVALAGAPSLLPGMPDEVVSIRHDRLTTEQYTALADEWRAYLVDHPQSAIAHVQIARALRYAGAPADEVAGHLDRALELGPECPEALDAAASRYLGEWESDDGKACYQLGLKAEHLAPAWADIHFTMHPLALALGRTDEADRHLAAILDKGGIPAPILDYCYNMLVGAAPNAIIFTNGDNDTYGTLALQAARGIRPDVLVLNLSLMTQPEIREMLMAREKDGGPLGIERRDELYRQFIEHYVRDREMYSTKFVKAVVADAAAGKLDRPIYLALTVHHSVSDAIPSSRRLEGTLWRLLPGTEVGDKSDAGTDVARTWELFQGPYRLESATDLSLSWSTHRSVAHIMDNYPAVLIRLAANAARDHRRRLHTREQLAANLAHVVPTATPPPDHALAAREAVRLVEAALDDLPADYGAAFHLRVREGFSYREMAAMTGDPEGTLRSRVHHTLQRLREKLAAADARPDARAGSEES